MAQLLSAWREIEGLRVWASPEALCCVLEHKCCVVSLSISVKIILWLNPGRSFLTWLKNWGLDRKESNQTKQKLSLDKGFTQMS